MVTSNPRLRRLTLLAKIVLACAILGYLIVQAQRHEGFARVVSQPKQWSVLTIGVGCLLVSVGLSFVRWYLLVRALGLSFRLVDALRLGSLGFALNFVALGNVGGDLFKAIFIARDQPGQRTEAVATVVVDRVLGLFTMLVLASLAVVIISLDSDASTSVALLCQATLALTAIGFAGIGLALYLPGITSDRLANLLNRIPLAGPTAVRLLSAVHVYRTKQPVLLSAFLLSVVVDGLFIISFFLVANGLPMNAPTLAEHFFVLPLSVIAGAIPVTPSGLGTIEAAVETLYQAVPSGARITPGDGTIIALAHRVAMMIVAGIGMIFYALQRSGKAPTPTAAKMTARTNA